MRRRIETRLPKVDAPMEWAVAAHNLLYTSHIPIRADGTIAAGCAGDQMELALANLRQALEAAGGSLDDVMQVQLFLIDAADFAAVNEVYQRAFAAPYPSRVTVVVSQLLVPGMRVELIASAYVDV